VQFPALREFVGGGKPVWGTCAGLIFLANKAVGEWLTNLYLLCSFFGNQLIAFLAGQKTGGQELVGGLDCTVHRNFFGSQVILGIV
jgi:5'-phosphate synthase pdxT subunit